MKPVYTWDIDYYTFSFEMSIATTVTITVPSNPGLDTCQESSYSQPHLTLFLIS